MALLKRTKENHFNVLWKDFFRDPSQWHDLRSRKFSEQYPDFKHKVTGKPLWVNCFHNPPWVVKELKCQGLALSSRVHTRSKVVALVLVNILRGCSMKKDLLRGITVHDEILEKGLLKECIDSLITMYAKCGELAKAEELLDMHKSREIISWTALIAAYNQRGQCHDALRLFDRMQEQGLTPDSVLFVCALKACETLRIIEKGETIHDAIARQGLLGRHATLDAALMRMYAKCGALAKAQGVFDKLPDRNAICWSTLISGYAQEGQSKQALTCFEKMRQEGVSYTVSISKSVLRSCGNLGDAHLGEHIHDELRRNGHFKSVVVIDIALADMYVKCGNLAKARDVLEKSGVRDCAAWSVLLVGYIHAHQVEQALSCYEEMQCKGISPDVATFSCILKACGSIQALDKGEKIHGKIASWGLLENNVVLRNSVVVMYAKCGAFTKAQQVLEGLPCRDVSSWNALLMGLLQQGQYELTLKCFKLMQDEGLFPNALTFVCVLNACSHLGSVDDGQSCFEGMCAKYGLKPNIEHYTCMIDLFGQAGHLDKAVKVTQQIPFYKDSAVWCALLSACRKQRDVNVGRWAFQQAVNVDVSDPTSFVLMADIYAAAGMQEEAERIKALSAKEVPGCSWWVDKSGNAHMFHVGDRKHVQINAIHAELENLSYRLSEEGYSPCLYWVSSNISYDSKMDLLCGHSSKLALTCALINTPQRERIRIVHNLRLCSDCHAAIALISKLEMREILVRDVNRCHGFIDGKCSCGDYE